MQFQHSSELSAIQNSTGGLAGAIPVRQHRHGHLENIGALRAQRDWRAYVGPLKDFKGGMAAKYGLMQVAVPECLPERLEAIAYASEIGFLYDDCTELLNEKQLSRTNDTMQSNFEEGVRNVEIDPLTGGLRTIQSKMLKEMTSIDQTRAMTTMKLWQGFLQESAGRQHDLIHDNFDAYMRYRVSDVGEMFWFGLVTFGMALSVPESEFLQLRALTRPCWNVLALQNDLCSWEKERDAAKLKGSKHVVNALWFLMRENSVDLEEAKSFCRQLIERNVKHFQEIVAIQKSRGTLSRDARIYMESLLYTISGDAAWSLITPRYNRDQIYSDHQLEMLGIRST